MTSDDLDRQAAEKLRRQTERLRAVLDRYDEPDSLLRLEALARSMSQKANRRRRPNLTLIPGGSDDAS
jgi:hypothetical protein